MSKIVGHDTDHCPHPYKWATGVRVGMIWQCDCGQYWHLRKDGYGITTWKPISDRKRRRLMRTKEENAADTPRKGRFSLRADPGEFED